MFVQVPVIQALAFSRSASLSAAASCAVLAAALRFRSALRWAAERGLDILTLGFFSPLLLRDLTISVRLRVGAAEAQAGIGSLGGRFHASSSSSSVVSWEEESFPPSPSERSDIPSEWTESLSLSDEGEW